MIIINDFIAVSIQHYGVKTAILGGGITGITLARLLQERGEDVIVLEKEPEIGGLCRSKEINGFTYDIGGSHIIFSRDEEVLSLMKAALAENRDERTRNTKIYYKGGYVKYPFENGLYQLPKEDCFFCLNEFVKTLIAVEKGEVPPPKNFRDWIYHTFGKGIAESYMIPYNEKIWNFPSEKMSMHWVEGRVPRPPVEDIIRSAIGIETEGYTHQSVFSYPVKGGIESLVHALAEPVEDCIVKGFNIVSVVREGNGDFIISDGREQIRVQRLYSTIPLQELLGCIDGVPEEVQTACNSLKYNSLICVFVGLQGEVPDFSWLYIPENEPGFFNRVSFPSNYSTAVAPDGQSSVLVEVTCNEGDAIYGMSDDEIKDHVLEGLLSMQILKNTDDVVCTDVQRQKFAYVVYDLEYNKNIGIVRKFCNEEDIVLTGRFSEFEYLNMDGCIRSVLDTIGADP